ncbi:MAG: hypothetical protein HC880_12515, partial [Bacteroidia bacterium]|nr:hypothetical protein [Bacteroidia bacterium]
MGLASDLWIVSSPSAQHAEPIVLDLWQGGRSDPNELKSINISGQPMLFFTAGFPSSGREPGRAIGNRASIIRDVIRNASGSEPREYTALNGWVYFFLNETSSSTGVLWRTDGTDQSTERVTYIYRNDDSRASWLTSIGGRLFFAATRDNPNNVELWSSNGEPGTANAAVLTQNINIFGGSFPENLQGQTLDGVDYLFFSADDGLNASPGEESPDRELFIKNVTTNTAAQKFNLKTTGGSNPRFFTRFQDRCYFIAENDNGLQLFSSNGATVQVVALPEDVQIVKYLTISFLSCPALSVEARPVVSGNYLFFVAQDPIHGTELWKFDGQVASLVTDINQGASPTNPHFLSDVNGTLYFAAATDAEGVDLYKSDGTQVEPLGISPTGPASSRFTSLTQVNGRLYFFKSDEGNCSRGELWYSDSNGDTRKFYDFNQVGATKFGQITVVGPDFYFVAEGFGNRVEPGGNLTPGNFGNELWYVRAEVCPSVTLAYTANADTVHFLCRSQGLVEPIHTFNPRLPDTPCPGDTCYRSNNPALSIHPRVGFINTNTTPPGTYEISYQYSDRNCVDTLSIQTTVILVDVPDPQINGPDALCAGAVAVYQTTEPPDGAPYRYLYNWKVSGGTIIGGQGTSQITAQWGHVIDSTEYVQVDIQVEGSPCRAETPLPDEPGSKAVRLTPQPRAVITSDNGGLGSLCVGIPYRYRSEQPFNPLNRYTWLVEGSTFTEIAPNEIEIVWTTPGQGSIRLIEALESPTAFCADTSEAISLQILESPGPITTNDRFVCNPPHTIRLQVQANDAALYRWYAGPTDTSPVQETSTGIWAVE